MIVAINYVIEKLSKSHNSSLVPKQPFLQSKSPVQYSGITGNIRIKFILRNIAALGQVEDIIKHDNSML